MVCCIIPGCRSGYKGTRIDPDVVKTPMSNIPRYDYGRGRYGSSTTATSPVTSSYRSTGSTTSSYRPSYTGTSTYSRDLSNSRDLSRSRDLSSSRDKYTSPSYLSTKDSPGERLSLRDKYSSGTYTSRDTPRSYSASTDRDRKDPDVEPYSSLTLGRRNKPKDTSPEPTRQEDKGKLSDRVGYGTSNSLSPYRLYGRSTNTYGRSTSRDTGNETGSSTTTTPASTPVHTPASLRFGSTTRFGGPIIRSPVSEKTPPVFGVSNSDRFNRSGSKPSVQESEDTDKKEQAVTTPSSEKAKEASCADLEEEEEEEEEEDRGPAPTVLVSVVTRGTSPTPPSTSSYLRTRRAEMSRSIEKTIARPTKKPEMADKEIQSDRGDDTARLSRFGSTSRASTSQWSPYLDRYSSTGSSYSPVSRYSSRSYGGYGATARNSETVKSPDAASKTSDSDALKSSYSAIKPSDDKSKDTIVANGTSSPIAKSDSNPDSSTPVSNEPKKEIDTLKESTGAKLPNTSSKAERTKTIENSKPVNELSKVVLKRVNSSKSLNSKPPLKTEPQSESPLKSKSSSSSEGIQTPPNTPTATKPELTNSTSQSSEGVKAPTVSRSTSKTQIKSEPGIKSRSSSTSSVASESSEVNTPTLSRTPSKTLIKSEQAESTPKSKSSSNSSLASDSVKVKTVSRTLSKSDLADTTKEVPKSPSDAAQLKPKSQAKQGLPDSPTSKLPPPVPKADGLKPSPSLLSLNKFGVANKDFRKSSLNVELNNELQAEAFREMQDKQRKGVKVKKIKRTVSAGSGESDTSSAASGSLSAAGGNSTDLSASKSLTNIKQSSSSSACLQTKKAPEESKPSLPKPQGLIKTKSVIHVKGNEKAKKTGHRSSSSSESSSSESSSSDSSCSDSDDENSTAHSKTRPTSTGKLKSTKSLKSVITVSSADESSMSTDKPLRSPSSPKPPIKADQTTSLLMRGLASVTSLFRGKQQDAVDSIATDVPQGAESTPDVKKPGEETKVKKHRIRHQESGERAWWLDSNPNIPEGIQRIQSSSSIHKDLVKDNQKPVESNTNKVRPYKIRHQESGEKAWWLGSNESIPEGVQKVMSNNSIPRILSPQTSDSSSKKEEIRKYQIRHQESGEKAWWLSSNSNIPEGILKVKSNKSLSDFLKNEAKNKEKPDTTTDESSDEDSSDMETSDDDGKTSKASKESKVPKFPLVLPVNGVRAKSKSKSPPKLSKEEPGRTSPYDNMHEDKNNNGKPAAARKHKPRNKNLPLFISSHTNIDDILGSAATLVNPAMGMSRLRKAQKNGPDNDDSEEEDEGSLAEEVDPKQVKIHDNTAQTPRIRHVGAVTDDGSRKKSDGMIKLDDTALQLYKDGDYGSYLDLEASINEQQEEFEGFQSNRKNSIVLRTQLSVRVHSIIEKLLNSEGRELRRALFSLKQIFQEDKDLVHEFVQNDGLACLIKVGSEADQNYQNYILRALGQVMLYVDGMNGVMEHNQTLQWLYTLILSKFRLVVKTALKLLLVFVEYVETNCLLLIKAVHAVDTIHGLLPWSNVMRLLKDYDAADTELLIYAMTLVNKTLNGVPDQDTYYDQADAVEEQGIEGAIQRYMSKQGTDLDLLRQFQIYEAVLHHEDGEEKGTPLRQLDDTIRKTLRNRKSLTDTTERRKSRRHSTGTSPLSATLSNISRLHNSATPVDDDGSESSSSRGSPAPQLNGGYKENNTGDAGVTPALRRRRERAERQRSFIREQQESAATLRACLSNNDEDDENQKLTLRINGSLDGGDMKGNNRVVSRKDLTPLLNAANKLDSESEAKKPWLLSLYGKNGEGESPEGTENGTENGRDVLLQLKRENTVKDLTQKLASQNALNSPVDENSKVIGRIGDMTGLISKAKEGLAKSKSKADVLKSPTGENLPKFEVKKSETELHWEELVHSMSRPLSLCDLDFTDLKSDDEVDILSPTHVTNGGPPPPPPVPTSPRSSAPPPPPPSSRFAPPPMPMSGIGAKNQRNGRAVSPEKTLKKTKKTVKLFWKEVRDDPIILAKLHKSGMIWDELKPVLVDTQKLEHLFESKAKDLITKEKQQELNKTKEIIVLDHKRSNAINIGMTKLPPPRSIKTAILKMDATIMNREGIEKLLTMLPTEEERSKIQEAQVANPDMPLGSAEQFLLTLASISELPARLKLWAFKLDFENSEKEIAEPLMDLKQGMETLKANKTFRGILSTLLSIGIFLNGNEVKGFQIEYLAKVPEVKDTVHKHSLLHHLCHMVLEQFPEATDLYSEIGAVTRASKVDFDELGSNIGRLEMECKASWDHLKVIAKHDGSTMMKVKMSDFLADCAERIIVLGIVNRRVMNRFHKFMLWLGIPMHRVQDMKPNELCRVVSEFALEYRTTRERVMQQLEKKANHRERNKTRGKMITEVGKFRTKEDRADAELRQLLGNDLPDTEIIHGTMPWRRQRKELGRSGLGPLIRDESLNGHLTDGDDEILESLVKTATKAPATRTAPRERKRTRNADRKSLKRSRTRENNTVEGKRESP